ncbi:Prephenate and/or arogenate dehydrogenase (unknown specificity) [hydrothermal vent metagenome]|uniref:Prephenate/arogenate dehydrogenase domain-containing protein n=1 Tax=hydrothermal vent metagenome TaxID=652676 RepID=A0A3B0WJS0_9ZZZZ
MDESQVKNTPLLSKVTIIGVGLIGGSFAKGLKEAGLADTVFGFGHNESTLKKAVELGVVDAYSTNMEEAVKDSDLIMLSVPLSVMKSVLQQMKPYLKKSAIITDAGSAKCSVIDAVQSVFGCVPTHFVPGHPIAGKEKSGVEAADASLFVAHRVILTPSDDTDVNAISQVTHLWQALGANVESMSAEHHDDIFAATSHLPHLLAFSLVDMLNEHEELGNVFPYTAGGFRDFTRIASSDATMWRDISIENSTAIVKWLKAYQTAITELTTLVEKQDAEALKALFLGAKQARDKHIK